MHDVTSRAFSPSNQVTRPARFKRQEATPEQTAAVTWQSGRGRGCLCGQSATPHRAAGAPPMSRAFEQPHFPPGLIEPPPARGWLCLCRLTGSSRRPQCLSTLTFPTPLHSPCLSWPSRGMAGWRGGRKVSLGWRWCRLAQCPLKGRRLLES